MSGKDQMNILIQSVFQQVFSGVGSVEGSLGAAANHRTARIAHSIYSTVSQSADRIQGRRLCSPFQRSAQTKTAARPAGSAFFPVLAVGSFRLALTFNLVVLVLQFLPCLLHIGKLCALLDIDIPAYIIDFILGQLLK